MGQKLNFHGESKWNLIFDFTLGSSSTTWRDSNSLLHIYDLFTSQGTQHIVNAVAEKACGKKEGTEQIADVLTCMKTWHTCKERMMFHSAA